MKITEYLDEYRSLMSYAKKCAEQADDAMHSQLHSPSFEPRVKSSGTYSLDNIAQKIEAAEARYRKAKDKYFARYDELTEMLSELDNLEEENVIFFRYEYRMPWERIAKKMQLSERTVLYIHGRALKHLDKILTDRKEGNNGTDHTDDT